MYIKYNKIRTMHVVKYSKRRRKCLRANFAVSRAIAAAAAKCVYAEIYIWNFYLKIDFKIQTCLFT